MHCERALKVIGRGAARALARVRRAEDMCVFRKRPRCYVARFALRRRGKRRLISHPRASRRPVTPSRCAAAAAAASTATARRIGISSRAPRTAAQAPVQRHAPPPSAATRARPSTLQKCTPAQAHSRPSRPSPGLGLCGTRSHGSIAQLGRAQQLHRARALEGSIIRQRELRSEARRRAASTSSTSKKPAHART